MLSRLQLHSKRTVAVAASPCLLQGGCSSHPPPSPHQQNRQKGLLPRLRAIRLQRFHREVLPVGQGQEITISLLANPIERILEAASWRLDVVGGGNGVECTPFRRWNDRYIFRGAIRGHSAHQADRMRQKIPRFDPLLTQSVERFLQIHGSSPLRCATLAKWAGLR